MSMKSEPIPNIKGLSSMSQLLAGNQGKGNQLMKLSDTTHLNRYSLATYSKKVLGNNKKHESQQKLAF